MNNDLFDNMIKGGLEGHEIPVPADAWNNIAGKERKRRFGFVWWLFAVLVLGGGTIFFIQQRKSSIGTNPAIAVQQRDQGNKNTASEKISITQNDSVNQDSQTAPKAKPVNAFGENNNLNSLADENLEQRVVSRNKGVSGNGQSYNNISKKEIYPASENLSAKNKRSLKQKAKVQMSISAPGTENGTEEVPGDAETGFVKNEVADTAKVIAETAALKNKMNAISKEDTLTKPKEAQAANTTVPGKKRKANKWQFELSAMPLTALQQYDRALMLNRTSVEENLHSDFSVKRIRTSVAPAVAVSAAVVKQLNGKLKIGAGIQYMQLKEKMNLSGTDTTTAYTVVKRLVEDPAGNYLRDDSVKVTAIGARSINAMSSYTSYSIPLFVQYEIYRKKLSLDLTGGIIFNLTTKYSTDIRGVFTERNGAALQSRKTNTGISFFAGLHAALPLNKRLDVFAAPQFIFKPGSYTLKNMIIDKKIQQAGISIGLSFKF